MWNLKALFLVTAVLAANVSYQNGIVEIGEPLYACGGPLDPCPPCSCYTAVEGIDANGEYYLREYNEFADSSSETACRASCATKAYDHGAAVACWAGTPSASYGYAVFYPNLIEQSGGTATCP